MYPVAKPVYLRRALATLVVLACGLVAAAGAEPERDAAWVDARVSAWQLTREERRFDEIGWADDLREAERLAKEHGRLVFLFTHDGHMNVGRC